MYYVVIHPPPHSRLINSLFTNLPIALILSPGIHYPPAISLIPAIPIICGCVIRTSAVSGVVSASGTDVVTRSIDA